MLNSDQRDDAGREEAQRRQENDVQYDYRAQNDEDEAQYDDGQYEDSSRATKGNDRVRARGRKGDRYAKRQELLNVVNHVLNEDFPDKALLSNGEFLRFLKKVEDKALIQSDDDRREYITELGTVSGGIVSDHASPEEIAQMFCDYARELYYFAGGTLICTGLGREAVEDGSYPYAVTTEKILDDDKSETEAPKKAPVPTSRFVRDTLMPQFRLIFDLVKQISPLDVKDWNAEEYGVFLALSRMKFSDVEPVGNSAPGVSDALRRLSGAFDDLYQEADDDEVEFRLNLPNLERFYSWVDRKINLSAFPTNVLNQGALYGLKIFVREAAEAEGVRLGNATAADDDRALFAVAKFVLTETSFAYREFRGDPADFADFGKEMVRVGGATARVSVDAARRLFFAVGGKLIEDESVESESDTKEPWKKSRADLIKKILVEEFPDGMDLESEEALETFRRLGREYAVDYFEEPDDARLRAIIARPSLSWQGKAFVLSEAAKKRLENAIDGVLDLRSKAIYYDALFEKNRVDFENLHIGDPLLLRALIAFYFSRYWFYEFYFEPERNSSSELSKLTREILRGWGRDEELTAEQLAGRVNVGAELINTALQIDVNHFAPRDGGAYVRVAGTTDSSVSDEELDERFCRATSRIPNEQGLNGKEFLTALSSERTTPEVEVVRKEQPVRAPRAKSAEAPVQTPTFFDSASIQKKSEFPRKSAVDVRKNDWAAKMAELDELDLNKSVQIAPQESKAAKSVKSEPKTVEFKPVEPTSGGSTPAPEEPKLAPQDSTEKRSKRATIKSTAPTKELSSEELKERKKSIADTISSFDGLNLNDDEELALFRERAAEKGVVFGDDEDLLQEIQRVGFVCEDRLYVISKKTKERLCNVATEWFAQGGRLIYYVAVVDKGSDWLAKAGIANVPVLKNRFQKYVSGCFFHDEYFEVDGDEEFNALSETEKVKEEILRVWDGKTSKRLSELVEALFIPRDKIDEVLKNDSDFISRSNGYWAQDKPSGGRKRNASIKRKSSKRRPG